LDKRVPWKRVAALLREAYERVAPPALGLAIGVPPALEAPAKTPSLRDIDPMQSKRGQAVLKMMRSICLALPEAREVLQFGYPVWQAGKKTFAWARCVEQRLCVIFWVGVEAQGLLTADARYAIPAYMGHNGWIALDVHVSCDRAEVESLALASYRHFALRRMLQSLSLEVK
jgi:predicted DNA-binding protein (MmcQ/YjbR family)